MYEDPIVTEVREAGQALAEQAKGDLHQFFQNLREAQKQYQDRLVQAPFRRLQKANQIETRTTQDQPSDDIPVKVLVAHQA